MTAVEDSVGYLVYRYQATNFSLGGIAEIHLDVSAVRGVIDPSREATGPFRNLAATTPLEVTPHADVAPISPPNWQALLRRTGILLWIGANGGMLDQDSIAPGDSLVGFGIRSSFLPGITTASAIPTWQSCCSEPWGSLVDNPNRQHRNPDEFATSMSVIGPRHGAGEMDLPLLRGQVDAVCSELGWVTDRSLCIELRRSLDAANTGPGLEPQALRSLLNALEQAATASGRIDSGAYFLLRTNIRYLLESDDRASRD